MSKCSDKVLVRNRTYIKLSDTTLFINKFLIKRMRLLNISKKRQGKVKDGSMSAFAFI